MTKLTEVITDIIHTACQAELVYDEEIQRQALGDIYETIGKVLNRTVAAPATGEATAGRGGRDGTGEATPEEKQRLYNLRKYSFCDGLFPIRRANSEHACTEHCWIGGRRFTMELSQDIHGDGEHVCCAKIHDNGKLVVKCVVYRGKSTAEKCAHGAFKSYIRNLCGSGRFSSRGGFLKQAAFRRAAILTPAEELAETVRRQQKGGAK